MQSHPDFGLGQTFYNGLTIDTNDYSGSIQCEGKICEWLTDPNPTTTTTRRTTSTRKSIQVRNVSGIALLPGRICSFSSGFFGRRVDGYTTTTAAAAAGVVDPSLPSAGVPNGDVFHLMVSGPCLVRQALSNFGADLAQDDWVYAITGATSQCTTSGRFDRWVGTFGDTHTTNGTQGNILLNRIGRAMSTSLTSDTNANRLIWLDLPLAR